MDLRTFKYFLVAAEEKNISRAAERLYISQQALSNHIRRMEAQYNIILFERKPALRLTLAGERMVFYAKQLLATEASMLSNFADISGNCKGKLTIGISRLRSRVFFPDIWKSYNPKYPNISIVLRDGVTNIFEELLETGELDFYIGVDVPENPAICNIPLAYEGKYCIFHENLIREYYPDRWQHFLDDSKRGISLNKIKDLPFIMLAPGNRLRSSMDYYFSSNGILPHILLETNNQHLACQIAMDGGGLAVVSPIIFYNFARTPGFQDTSKVYIRPIIDFPESLVTLDYRSNLQLPHYAHALIAAVKDTFDLYNQTLEEALQRFQV